MKLKLFIIVLFISSKLFATDRFVDLNLSSSNGTTLFKTINSAVTAAVNGDRILITAGTYGEPILTLNKSLTLLPQVAGTMINYNANIVIAGFPGMKLEILGFNLGVYSLISSSAGTSTNRAKVSIIDCSISNIDLNIEGFDCNIFKNNVSGQIIFKYGNVVLNNTNNIYLADESLDNPISSNGKILISGNTINNLLYIYNNDNKFVIANNLIKNFLLKRWYATLSDNNKIINNEFNSSKLLVATNSVP